MKLYKDELIWIVGASSGIGRALAIELSNQGARLILSARNHQKLDELNAQLGDRHIVYPLDAKKRDDYLGLEGHIGAGIDRAIFMAGIYEPMKIESFDLGMTEDIISTNLTGAIYFVHAVLPAFLRQRRGQIAICASVAGYCGLPNSQPYGATKAALINYTESLRSEVAGRGIDVRIINPGFVRTPLTDKNNFRMPMITEPEKAAEIIALGLKKGGFEIHFPRRFTIMLKILSWLPYSIYFRLVRRAV